MYCSEILVAMLLEKNKENRQNQYKKKLSWLFFIFFPCPTGSIARGSSLMTLSSDLETHIPPSHLDLSSAKNFFPPSIENLALGSRIDPLQSEAAA